MADQDTLGINKVVVLMWLSVIMVFGLMFAGSRKKALVPVGIQNFAESAVDFIHNGIILQTMGPDGMGYAPLAVHDVHVHLRAATSGRSSRSRRCR